MIPPTYPATVGPFCVYVALTDGAGDIPTRLQVVEADEVDPDPLSIIDVELSFSDRFDTVEVARAFTDVTFPRPGEYRVQLLVAGSLAMERRLVLVAPAGQEDA